MESVLTYTNIADFPIVAMSTRCYWGPHCTKLRQTAYSKANSPFHSLSEESVLCPDTDCLPSLKPEWIRQVTQGHPIHGFAYDLVGKDELEPLDFQSGIIGAGNIGRGSQSAVRTRITGLLMAPWVSLWQILPFPRQLEQLSVPEANGTESKDDGKWKVPLIK